MENKQIISKFDPLRSFKEKAKQELPNCAFFSSPINSLVDVGAGLHNGCMAKETIITDGDIALQKKNLYKPIVVWQNQVLTLENGTSISIKIENATFMIAITKYQGQEQIDIHVAEEERDLLERILNSLSKRQEEFDATSSISFTSPTLLTLNSIVKGNRKIDTFDFSSGKTKQFGKKHHRR